MSALTTAATKHCTSCDTTHPIDEFPFKNRATGRRHSRCKARARQVSRDHHAHVKQTVNPKIRARKQQTAADHRIRVRSLLTQLGCHACDTAEPSSLRLTVPEGTTPLGRQVSNGTAWATLQKVIHAGTVSCRRH